MNRIKEYTGAAPTNNQIIIQEEMRASDNCISVQIVTPGSSTTFTYECSNDGVNWVACPGIPVGWIASPTATSTSNTAGFLVFMNQFRYFRVRCSTAGTGNVSLFAAFGEGWIR